ncbi:hypothetical protein GA0115260_131831, partial [Streptomyces sp. MnatMP-M27]
MMYLVRNRGTRRRSAMSADQEEAPAELARLWR